MTSFPSTEPRPGIVFVCAPALLPAEQEFPWAFTLLFLAAHALVVPLLVRIPALAAVHAIAIAVAAMLLALAPTKRDWVVCAGAYICACEVLWRMSHAPLFWEFAKYSIAASMLVSLLTGGVRRFSTLPLVYAMLLIPSIVKTATALRLSEAESQISFNLSGPFLLAVAVLFFENIDLTSSQFQRVVIAFLGPAVGLAAAINLGIAGSSRIVFYTESNPMLSGGYGPNQVAAILGFGAVLGIFLLLSRSMKMGARLILGTVVILLAAQSALTFSRGGIYCLGTAIVVSAVILWRDAACRLRIVTFTAIAAAAGVLLIGPALNSFTKGSIEQRFADASLTHRGDLILEDLDLWEQNPILGVGPGMAKAWHLTGLAAHTEFSRDVAEHGLLGFGALVVLAVMAVQQFLKTGDLRTSAMCAAFLMWSLLYMGANAMRLAAPAFVFGLGFANLQPAFSGRVRVTIGSSRR